MSAGCDPAAARAWAVAIFAARETPEVLFATLSATVAASAESAATVIDLLVNGNPALAEAAALRVRERQQRGEWRGVRVWRIELGDKSHAWSQYLHQIWPGSQLAFFIDGYVRLKPDALARLGAGMQSAPNALGGSGVPSGGRAAARIARTMLDEGGIHGNLCCIRRSAMLQLRQRQFRFPLGIYRADGLLGAILAFRLDPRTHPWDLKNAVHVEAGATWDVDPKRWWRPGDIRATLRRRARQSQGELENRAMREHLELRQQAPESLPLTSARMVLDWAGRNPEEAAKVCRNGRVARALDALRAPRDWSAAELSPTLLVGEGMPAIV